jgi:hypothetical protein
MKRIALTTMVIVSILIGSISVLVSTWASAAPASQPGIHQLHTGDNWIEAEHPTNGTIGAWALQNGDTSVSNKQYMLYSASNGGTLEYTFQLNYAGPLYVWLRASGVANSSRPIKIQLDGGPTDQVALEGTGWAWKLDDDAVYSVGAGKHTLRLIGSTAQVKLDRLLITTRKEMIPSGLGASAPTVSPVPTAPQAPTATRTPTKPPTQVPTATRAPTQAPATSTPATGAPRLLFGIGPEADSALKTQLVQEAPARMLTSWYNGPNDLAWMTGWRKGLVPRAYADGYTLHLVVFSDGAETQIATKYGSACGRAYPLSERFPDDMRQLAQTFAGTAGGPPLYVTLFTEFQTYPCKDNAWNADAQTNAYYRALKDRYLETLAIFHQHAPNAKVSLGWGGWQARFDDPKTGAGRSMFAAFADVMRASDFQSFQAMQSDSNVDDVRAMVKTLGAYGPVMLAHYKPDNGSQATFERDLRAMLTDSYLAEMTRAGLFAWSFMDNKNLAASAGIYQFTRDAVGRYAR